MRVLGHILAGTCLLCLAAAPSRGELTPAEVLVVANEASPESVELAKTYVKLRGIPEQNLALVRTATGYEVSRELYDSQIAEPLRKLLAEGRMKDRVRCLALMWGVPVRVAAPAAPAATPLQQAYKRQADRAHYQAVIAHKFLGTVGVAFPEPRTNSFKPLGALFDSKVAAPEPPLPKLQELQADIGLLFRQKQAEVARIDDPQKRTLAWRQLMAIEMELRGLRGLKEMVETAKPPTAPDPGYLDKLITASTSKLAEIDKGPQAEQSIAAGLEMLGNLSGAFGVYEQAMSKCGAEGLDAKQQTFLDRTLQASDASVDSELALLLWPPYKLEGWLDNPLCLRYRARPGQQNPPVLMTARIDGPTSADAERIVKASLQAEADGLTGNFYIDAGGGTNKDYDKNLQQLYTLVKANTSLKVILDDQPTVFQPGACPDAALYVGWYSLRKYVPAFTWSAGAVGWHIASFEAEDLRNPDSQTWCVKMVQNGVAATIGPVAEPLLGSFPLPQDFFGLLLAGKCTLAECYWDTVPVVSWRLTLIGDPLYRPFARKPALTGESAPSPPP